VSRKLQAPRGTRDFYPEDLRLRAWLFEHFRAVARGFGFEASSSTTSSCTTGAWRSGPR
jgi:histidyl-tRNA synthetase